MDSSIKPLLNHPAPITVTALPVLLALPIIVGGMEVLVRAALPPVPQVILNGIGQAAL